MPRHRSAIALSVAGVAALAAPLSYAAAAPAPQHPVQPVRWAGAWTPRARVDRTPVGWIPKVKWSPKVHDRAAAQSGRAGAPGGRSQGAVDTAGVSPLTVVGGSSSAALGTLPSYPLYGVTLDDRLGVAVNVANGNLVEHSRELTIAGTGLALSIDRYSTICSPGTGPSGRAR